jgi:putative ABC transport system substrate-binding protein
MKRRAFLALSTGAAALAAPRILAQVRKRLRIGYLSPTSPPDPNLESFRRGMLESGRAEGDDYELEIRYAGRDYSRITDLAQELLAARVDIMVTAGAMTGVARLAAQTVPVVFGFSGDPVDAGIVESFAHPGGNATGFSMLQLDIASKRVELLKELAPSIDRVAVIANPGHPGVGSELQATRDAAKFLGLQVEVFEPANDETFPPVMRAVAASDWNALLAFPEALTLSHRETLAGAALHRRAPSAFGWKLYAQAGGLVSYGPDMAHAFMRLAYFVDRISSGARAADLPIERPTKLELVLNLKTANALGLTIPPSLLARADEVIE